MNLMYGCSQSQSGLKRCCRMKISFTTLFGMPNGFQSSTAVQEHGAVFLMNHGLETAFGRYK
jgi:hypothetical protein